MLHFDLNTVNTQWNIAPFFFLKRNNNHVSSKSRLILPLARKVVIGELLIHSGNVVMTATRSLVHSTHTQNLSNIQTVCIVRSALGRFYRLFGSRSGRDDHKNTLGIGEMAPAFVRTGLLLLYTYKATCDKLRKPSAVRHTPESWASAAPFLISLGLSRTVTHTHLHTFCDI